MSIFLIQFQVNQMKIGRSYHKETYFDKNLHLPKSFFKEKASFKSLKVVSLKTIGEFYLI